MISYTQILDSVIIHKHKELYADASYHFFVLVFPYVAPSVFGVLYLLYPQVRPQARIHTHTNTHTHTYTHRETERDSHGLNISLNLTNTSVLTKYIMIQYELWSQTV